MKRIKVALCGASAVGKTSILETLSTLTGTNMLYCDRATGNYLWTLRVKQQDLVIEVAALAGGVLNLEDEAPRLLKNADLIVLVADGDERSVEKQEYSLPIYVQAARNVKKTWDDIPWIYVLNRVDRGSRNPVAHLPLFQHLELRHRTIAKDGVGIQELWQDILNRLGIPSNTPYPRPKQASNNSDAPSSAPTP